MSTSFFCLRPSLYLLLSWAWWDWPLTWLTNRRPSVLWHCWLGHVTRKIVSEMTYNVSSGTLTSTIPYHTFEMIAAALTHAERWRHWCTAAAMIAWRTQFMCGVWGRRDQSCIFCTSSLAVCPTHCRQLDLNLANLEATVEAEWILAFLFLWKRRFEWHHHCVIITQCRASIDGTFYNFSVFQNYEKLSESVKIMVRILSVPFIWTRCILLPGI